MRILKATYGSGDCVLDVTERLQGLVKNGRLSIVVSNSLFTDPCPGKVKTLHFAYELPGSSQFYSQETTENGTVIAPLLGDNRIGIFYTNNTVPPKYLDRVLRQLEKAASDVDIITCPWHPIEGSPFPELPWFYHVSHHLTMTLQILNLLYKAEELGDYKYVFFLEHDVLYPEGYFEIEPFSEDVLETTNYIGLCEEGFQPVHPSFQPLHQLAMRLPVAIEHFTSCIRASLGDPNFSLEPQGRTWAKRESAAPAVHINHGRHFTSYSSFFSKDEVEKTHPYWGSAASWWD